MSRSQRTPARTAGLVYLHERRSPRHAGWIDAGELAAVPFAHPTQSGDASPRQNLSGLRRTAGKPVEWSEQQDPHAGATVLTPRESTVLSLLAEGLTAAAIARRLSCSTRTVQKHLERVYAKLDVHDRLSAVLKAQQKGLLPPAR